MTSSVVDFLGLELLEWLLPWKAMCADLRHLHSDLKIQQNLLYDSVVLYPYGSSFSQCKGYFMSPGYFVSCPCLLQWHRRCQSVGTCQQFFCKYIPELTLQFLYSEVILLQTMQDFFKAYPMLTLLSIFQWVGGAIC